MFGMYTYIDPEKKPSQSRLAAIGHVSLMECLGYAIHSDTKESGVEEVHLQMSHGNHWQHVEQTLRPVTFPMNFTFKKPYWTLHLSALKPSIPDPFQNHTH